MDDRTLRVDLNCPTPYFLQCTAHTLYSPVHRLIDQQYPQWPYQAGKDYPCNGAFQLRINHPDKGYQLTKNPHYWDANQVTLEQITMNRMNSVEAYQRFQKKEVDWIGLPFAGWDPSFNNTGKEGQIISFPNDPVSWCVFNTASTFEQSEAPPSVCLRHPTR